VKTDYNIERITLDIGENERNQEKNKSIRFLKAVDSVIISCHVFISAVLL
jgi:hypothetical protein